MKQISRNSFSLIFSSICPSSFLDNNVELEDKGFHLAYYPNFYWFDFFILCTVVPAMLLSVLIPSSLIHMSLAFPDLNSPEHYLSVCLPPPLHTCCQRWHIRPPAATNAHTPSDPQSNSNSALLHAIAETGTFAKVFQFGTLVRSK